MEASVDLHEEAGKENEQTLANLSPAEEATSIDEVKIDVFVPLLSCLAIYTQEKITDSHFWIFLGYLKNTFKNPKFGRVRQVPIWELSWEFPGWDLSHFAKFGIFMGIL